MLQNHVHDIDFHISIFTFFLLGNAYFVYIILDYIEPISFQGEWLLLYKC